MSNWITDEANANNQREHEEANRQRLIRASNYWSKLVRQVEADVNTINQHPYWQKKLAGSPLHFGQDFTGQGYQISKSGNSAVMVAFRNLGDQIFIERTFVGSEEVAQAFSSTESLSVVTSGTYVVLRSNNHKFAVPEDASRHILKPIIECLKTVESREGQDA